MNADNTPNTPPPAFDPDLVDKFLSGELAAEPEIFDLIDQSDEFLDAVDAAWKKQMERLEQLDIPELEPETANRLEARLFERIRRSELAGHTLRMSTLGLVEVFTVLLRPFFAFGTSPRSRDNTRS